MTVAYIIAILLSCALAWVCIPRIIHFAKKYNLYDQPNARKVHSMPVPRLAGLVFFPIIAITTILIATTAKSMHVFPCDFDMNGLQCVYLFLAFAVIYAFGLRDDIAVMRYRAKFLSQVIAGVLLCMSGLWLNDLHGFFGLYQLPAWAGYCFTVFAVVLVTNAINFIDGIDGLAGSLCAIAAIVMGVGMYLCGNYVGVLACCSMVGVLVAFLWFNLHGKAKKGNKIFMGDLGSDTLGFMLCVFGIWLSRHELPHGINIDTFVLAFAPLVVPCIDVVRVVLMRLVGHHNPFRADKTHVHHLLLAMGYSQHQALAIVVTLSVLITGLSIVLSLVINVNYVLLIDFVIWVAINMIFINRIKAKQ